MALEKNLILLRPSALSRGLAGEILSVFYKKVLRICGLKMMLPDENFSGHYFHLAGKNFFRRARDSMIGSCRGYLSEGINSLYCNDSYRVYKWAQSGSGYCPKLLSQLSVECRSSVRFY